MAIFLPINKINLTKGQHFYLVENPSSKIEYVMMIDSNANMLVFFRKNDLNNPIHSISFDSDQKLGKLPDDLNILFPKVVRVAYQALKNNDFPNDLSIFS